MFRVKPYHRRSTSKEFKTFYSGRRPIGVGAVVGGSCIKILDIAFGIEDRVIVEGYTGDLHNFKLYYPAGSDRCYFRYSNGCRYYLDEFISVQ